MRRLPPALDRLAIARDPIAAIGDDVIAPRTALDRVDCVVTSHHSISARAGRHTVLATTGDDLIASRATAQEVIPVPPLQLVIAASTVDAV